MDSNNRKTPRSTGVHRIICQKCICSGVSGYDREDEQDIETRGEALKYVTMQASGKAVPAYGGQWRKKEIFNTMQEADSWLEEMAGIGKEE